MRNKYLIAAALLVATSAPISAQSVKAGIDAWQRSDYAAAVGIWRPLAENGEADAQFNLGQAYRLGRGVPTNLAAAKSWFERAAGQGHVDAQTTLGLLLFQNGAEAEGLKWLKKAAEQGEARALLVYGTALVNGDNVTQDPVLGYAYVSRSASQGLAPAKQTLDQLDQLLPAADRKRGLAMAQEMAAAATTGPEPAKAEAKPVETAAAKPVTVPVSKKAKAPAKSATVATPKTAKSPPKTSAKAAAEATPKKSARAAGSSTAPASGAWRIQLGAFSQKKSAEALYRKVSGKSALKGRRAFYVPAGKVTRLQVGPFESKSAAEAACRAVGASCFPVSTK